MTLAISIFSMSFRISCRVVCAFTYALSAKSFYKVRKGSFHIGTRVSLALEEPLPKRPLRWVTENPSVTGIFNLRILQLDKHTSVTLILIRWHWVATYNNLLSTVHAICQSYLLVLLRCLVYSVSIAIICLVPSTGPLGTWHQCPWRKAQARRASFPHRHYIQKLLRNIRVSSLASLTIGLKDQCCWWKLVALNSQRRKGVAPTSVCYLCLFTKAKGLIWPDHFRSINQVSGFLFQHTLFITPRP